MGTTMVRIDQQDDEKEAGFNPEAVGTSFAEWLEEERLTDQVVEAAVKELFSEQLLKNMQALDLTKSALAEMIGTSRSQLDRILDPACEGVTIGALNRAAGAVGKRLHIELRDID